MIEMNRFTLFHLKTDAVGQGHIKVKPRLARLIVLLLFSSAASFTHGQLVYKCQSQGKTTYSQEPCPGAQVVDIKPARVQDQSVVSSSSSGKDSLRKEKEKEKKMDKNQALSYALLSECISLDAQEKQQANVIHNSRDIGAVNAATNAFIANRKKHRELGC